MFNELSSRPSVNFTLTVMAFLTPLFVLFSGLEAYISSIPNSYITKKRLLDAASENVETLILGSSHPYYGLNPKYFPRTTYNLAHLSQTLQYDRLLYEHYRGKLPKLKYLILPVSYFTFRYDIADSPNRSRTEIYRKVYNFPSQVPAWDIAKLGYLGIYGNKESFKILGSHFAGKAAFPQFDNAGYETAKGEQTRATDLSGKVRVESHHSSMHADYVTRNTIHLKSLLTMARKDGIQVLMVTLPVAKSYSKYIKQDIYQEMLSIVKSADPDGKSPYFNYFLDNRFNAEDFRDNDHLNTDGANKFSELFVSDVTKTVRDFKPNKSHL